MIAVVITRAAYQNSDVLPCEGSAVLQQNIYSNAQCSSRCSPSQRKLRIRPQPISGRFIRDESRHYKAALRLRQEYLLGSLACQRLHAMACRDGKAEAGTLLEIRASW